MNTEHDTMMEAIAETEGATELVATARTEPAKKARRRLQRGMTLVEIMVVIAIIGTITVVLATGVLSSKDDADISTAQVQINKISEQLTMYRLKTGEFPESLSALVEDGKLEDKQLKDPWKKDLRYEAQGRNFTLCSGGPDGVVGGSDDICNTPKK